MSYFTNLFHFDRKITRKEFWIGLLFAFPLQMVFLVGASYLFYAFRIRSEVISLVACVLSCVPLIALCVQRWRDASYPMVGFGFLIFILLYRYDVLFFGMDLI